MTEKPKVPGDQPVLISHFSWMFNRAPSKLSPSVPGQSEEAGDRVKVNGECQARSSPTNVSSLQDLSQPRDGVGRPVWWSQPPGADRLGGGARWGRGRLGTPARPLTKTCWARRSPRRTRSNFPPGRRTRRGFRRPG